LREVEGGGGYHRGKEVFSQRKGGFFTEERRFFHRGKEVFSQRKGGFYRRGKEVFFTEERR
jgi:hypothetical protein